MKYLILGAVIFASCLFSCNHNNGHQKSPVGVDTNKSPKPTDVSKDKQEIQDLIRKVLVWSGAGKSIDLLPALIDNKDSVYIGFDMEKLKRNLDTLRATNFFSAGFIENYNQIISALDKGLRNHKYDKWSTGELPTFRFANDVDPWCECQDNLSWNLVEVEMISLNNEKGKLRWKWAKSELTGAPDWKDFRYKFDVEKENGKWKISYMEGFDFKESTKRDGI